MIVINLRAGSVGLLIGVLVCCRTGLGQVPASQHSQPTRQFPSDQIKTNVERIMALVPLPGVAVGVVHKDTLVYGAGFGVADRASQQPVTVHTLFQIGSVTKSFTTTLVGTLVDEGLLNFDAGIIEYLPSTLVLSPAVKQDQFTLRQLAGHLSGLPAQPSIDGRVIDSELVLSFTHFELYKSLRTATPIARPGEKFEYSMLGYGLLGSILEHAADRLVVVFVDKLKRDTHPELPAESNLYIHRKVVGQLVLYEVSPLDEPHVLDLFFIPE